MLFDFEKILNDNGIKETDTDLPRGILRKIEKFRAMQSKITADISIEDKQKIEAELDSIDADIMQTLPDYFDMEDEAETIAAQKKAEQDAAQKKAEKDAAKKHTKVAVKKVVAEDQTQKKEAEAKQARIAELSKPASNDKQALSNLFELGKTTVTTAELKKAGFNTGFFGEIGPTGCTIGEFKLYRKDASESVFTLTKK
jgi:hypothetical protein